MKLLTHMQKTFSFFIWKKSPVFFQQIIGQFLMSLGKIRISKIILKSFVKRYNLSNLHLYKPASGTTDYKSFHDFFTRSLKNPLTAAYPFIWPCEGQICEMTKVNENKAIFVKKQPQKIIQILNCDYELFKNHSFVNIFLHNNHYHRIHSPISGTICEIKKIPGRFDFLRPWLYKKSEVSYPALVNERVVISMTDSYNKIWVLCLVAGMGVGNILLEPLIKVGSSISVGEEVAHFEMGSTVCLLAPYDLENQGYLAHIQPGEEMIFRSVSTDLHSGTLS